MDEITLFKNKKTLNLQDTKTTLHKCTMCVLTMFVYSQRKPEDRQAQRTIAEEVTKLVHGGE